MKTYKFRIYPSKAQEKELCRHLWIAKEIWNNLLEATVTRYGTEKKFPSQNEMQVMVKKSGLYSQTAQSVAHRLCRALKAKSKAKREGRKFGFPRFKSFDRMKSLCYPQSGFTLGAKLKVTPFGEIDVKKHREIEGQIKTLTIKRMPSGKWFACFAVEGARRLPKENCGEAVGVDLGLAKFATLSDGSVIENPRVFKECEERLAVLQRRLSKKKRGSHNRLKAKHEVALLHEKIADTRKDFLHKAANDLLSQHSFVALEDLKIRDMQEQDYGKSIGDVSWGMFSNMLRYKAESAGARVVFVDPKNTTKACSCCGVLTKKELWERIHHCPSCGLELDRDLNAARNILAKATAGHAESKLLENGMFVPSVKEEAHTL